MSSGLFIHRYIFGHLLIFLFISKKINEGLCDHNAVCISVFRPINF
jgi:hypothetical protein